MAKHLLFLLSCLCLIALPGCKTGDVMTVSPSDLSAVEAVADDIPTSQLIGGNSIELSVEVAGRMEIAMHRASINQQGVVTLPLVGDVHIGGMTLSEARQVIYTTYGAYFVTPPVIMISRVDDAVQGKWGFVTMTGRVSQPGRVKIESANGIKLTSAIQKAGGFSGSAKKSGIRVSRIDSSGKKIQVKVDYDDIGQKGNIDADIDLKDGDIVYVPQRIF